MGTWFRPESPRPARGPAFVPRCEPLDDRALPSASVPGVSLSADLLHLGWIDTESVGGFYLPPDAGLRPLYRLAATLGAPVSAATNDWLPPVLLATVLTKAGVTASIVPPADPTAPTEAGGPPVLDVVLRNAAGEERYPIGAADVAVVDRVFDRFLAGFAAMRAEFGEHWADGVYASLRTAQEALPALPALLPPGGPLPPGTGLPFGVFVGFPKAAEPTGPAARADVPLTVDPEERPTPAPTPAEESHYVFASPVAVDPVAAWAAPSRTCPGMPKPAGTEPATAAREVGAVAPKPDAPADADGTAGGFEPEPAGVFVGGVVPFDAAELGDDVARFLAELAPLDAGSDVASRWWVDLLAAAAATAVAARRRQLVRRAVARAVPEPGGV